MSHLSRRAHVRLVLSLVLGATIAAAAVPANAQFVYQELHGFTREGQPQTPPIDGGDGHLYGITNSGGRYQSGALYRVEKSTQAFSLMVHFTTDSVGMYPQGGLVDGGDGFLYGATQSGSTNGRGAIFAFKKAAGTITMLHAMNSFADGYNVTSGLTLGLDGYLYGTTVNSGANNVGTVFRVDRATGALTVLYAFSPGTGGGGNNPVGRLAYGTDGFLYGTTQSGGANGVGTAFKINLSNNAFTQIFSFALFGSASPQPSGLVDPGNGFLYGSTYQGGSVSNNGGLYKIEKATGAYTQLFSFNGGTLGYYGASQPVWGNDGFIYGVTVTGGSGGGGTLYKLDIATETLSLVHPFSSATEGNSFYNGLSFDGSTFYTATSSGGPATRGTALGVDKTTGDTDVYYVFGREPLTPYGGLVDGGNGFLYGTTVDGGNGVGTVYKVEKSTGELTVFAMVQNTTGYYPYGTLVDGPNDGFLYGQTYGGGPQGNGTVFKVHKTTDVVTVVHNFTVAEGYNRYADLTLGSDGLLYGTAYNGGTSGYGTLYRVDRVSGGVTVLYNFTSANPNPQYNKVVYHGATGAVYGTTQGGGANNCGTVYKVTTIPAVTITTLKSFACSGGDGYYGRNLIDGRDGYFYGTTLYGGQFNSGTLFRIDPASDSFSYVHHFANNFPQYEGQYHNGALLAARDGLLYGTSYLGGTFGYGAVWVIDKTTGAYGKYHDFNRNAGEGHYPWSGLAQGAPGDDTIYGTTIQGGANGGGVVFMFTTGTVNQTITPNVLPATAAYLNTFSASATGGGSLNPVVIAASGACSGGGNNGANITMTSGTGTCTVTFDQAGTLTYNPAPTVTRTVTAVKQFASLTMPNQSVPYDGTPKSLSVTTNPIGLAVDVVYTGTTVTYGPTATPPTGAGSYNVFGTINDVNYQGTISRSLVITKAPATISLTSLTQTYTGSPLSPGVMTVPAGLAYSLSGGAPRTDVGNYSVSATITDPNYAGSTGGTFSITKATATVTLDNLTQTYTGAFLQPTATTTPAGLQVFFSGGNWNAGSYTVTATVNHQNYQGSATGTLIIQKATATVTLSNLTRTYTGSQLTPTVTANPSWVPIVWTGAPQTNAGTYNVTATVNDTNYQGSASGTFIIQKAQATVSLGNLTQSYTGNPLTPSASTSPGAGLPVTWTGAPQTAVGSYQVTAEIDHANYQGSASGTFTIQKAAATVTLGDLTQTYTGSPLRPSATTAPANLALVWTNAEHTTAGSYAVTATIDDPSYQGSAGGTFTIQKASGQVSLSNLTQTYTGGALTPGATTTPVGLNVDWINAPQTAVGSYSVTARINDVNYAGETAGTFVIGKAAATVSLTNMTKSYTGGALAPGATTSPVGLALTWTGTPQTGVGSYPVSATVDDPNYEGTASGTFEIQKATTAVSLSNLTQTYTGGPLTPSASTSPAGLSINWTGAAQIGAGSYSVTATINDANYQGSATATFLIEKAPATVVLGDLTRTYTGSPQSPTAVTSPVVGLNVLWTNATHTTAGSYGVSATINDPNYAGEASGTFVIQKANATIVLGSLTKPFTGSAQSPSATTSPAGLTVAWTGAPQTNAGSYPVIGTINDTNYEGTASGTFVITPIAPTLAWATPAAIASGTPLGGTQLNASANVGGSFAYTPAATTVLGPGTHTLSALFTPADAVNYTTGTVTTTISVSASYSWSNFLQPIDLDNGSIFKLGSTIPVKFQLTGASAGITNLSAQLLVAKVSNAITGDEVEAVSTGAADSGNTFRYADGQYIFNLSTKALSQGTWQLRVDMHDGVTRTILISLKK